MTYQHIVTIIIVNRGIAIHNLSHDVSTDFCECGAKDDTDISFKPSKSWQKFVNASQMEPLNDWRLIEKSQNMGFGIFNISHRSKSKILIHKTLNHRISFDKCNVHLNCSLTMSNIMRLLIGDLIDIFEHSGQIIVSHMLEGKFPKLFIFVWIVLGVVSRVFVTATIAQPNIITSIGQHKSWGFVLIINNPSVRGIKQSMLKDYWFKPLFYDCVLPLDPKKREYVSIFSNHSVCLNWVVEELAVIGKVQFGLWMS